MEFAIVLPDYITSFSRLPTFAALRKVGKEGSLQPLAAICANGGFGSKENVWVKKGKATAPVENICVEKQCRTLLKKEEL
ncbi:MAG: hypothetical protein ACI9KK_002170 [Ascidiaceihabitans sp.]|jgi:uncharacterized protein YidB (DUF937 family)